ncbi:hypothetical protein [Amycolatopsis antarctica]|uniref:hypothetical protein n=1 Tax=Amycolatopsis antarctica TaxID=1854586 RepID=UPI0013FDA073|nr:hypothetical protein [Amycolatopsis antarctica]
MLARLDVLTSDQDREMYGLWADENGEKKVRGVATVFTKQVVAEATWSGESATQRYGDSLWEVRAVAWPRRLLTSISIPWDDDPTATHPNEIWGDAYEEGSWPRGATILLHYPSPGHDVKLPSRHLGIPNIDFRSFVATLNADLTAPM